MRACTTVEVGLRADGVSAVTLVRCEAPLLVRQDTADGVLTLWLVGGAAGPLGGDELSWHVVVGAGAVVRVRSVAAMLAQPGVRGDASILRTWIEVGEGAELDWNPEPIISVRGSDHRSTTVLRAAGSAVVRLADAAALGRHEEVPGRLALHQRVEVAGRPVLDHEVVLGGAPSCAASAALHGPGAHGPARLVRSLVLLGSHAATTPTAEVTPTTVEATYPLAQGASLQVRVGGGSASRTGSSTWLD